MRHTDNDGVVRYLLQHRSSIVQHGGSWGIPGGALKPAERPVDGAIREATEEMGTLPPFAVNGLYTEDHGGGWAYHVVLCDVANRFSTEPGPEQIGTAWYARNEMEDLNLFPRLTTTIDAALAYANGVGS
jgi:8-oxo-dGTP diphosphatase